MKGAVQYDGAHDNPFPSPTVFEEANIPQLVCPSVLAELEMGWPCEPNGGRFQMLDPRTRGNDI